MKHLSDRTPTLRRHGRLRPSSQRKATRGPPASRAPRSRSTAQARDRFPRVTNHRRTAVRRFGFFVGRTIARRVIAASRSSSSTSRCRHLDEAFVEGDAQPAARSLGHLPASRVIDQDAPHHLRGQTKEMRAVLPRDGFLAQQAHEGFMHQCRGLQRVIRSLASQIRRRLALQLVVHDRHELVSGTRHRRRSMHAAEWSGPGSSIDPLISAMLRAPFHSVKRVLRPSADTA